jgi:hypothetical protein
MHKSLFAAALAAAPLAFAQPAAAITFPSLTTIYVGAGVTDSQGFTTVGNFATAFACTNVSGQTASLRFLVLSSGGAVLASVPWQLTHGRHVLAATRNIAAFSEVLLNTGTLLHGTVNIESTQSGVFCTAMMVDATTAGPNGIALNLVRINPHPGAVE